MQLQALATFSDRRPAGASAAENAGHPLMENGIPAEASEAIGARLSLGGNKTLTIGEKDLVLHDPDWRKAKKTATEALTFGRLLSLASCRLLANNGDGNGKLSVPLYNVLWAEASGDSFVVDYAVQHKSSLKHQKWTFPIATSEAGTDGLSPQAFASTLRSHAYGPAKLRKRALALINPNSGPGGASNKWKKHARPLFEAARMELEVVTLTGGGEATELVEKADLEKYDTIMAVSGDGTPHEIFNGLARRSDAKKALSKIAVSHIPCGSGNAFSLNAYGTSKVAFAALAIVKGVVMPLDLVSITQSDRRIVSFLSQALGIIAESDLGTENLRWMGGTRFEVGLMMRIFKKKCYPCDLAVKVEIDSKEKIKQHYRQQISDPKPPKVETDGVAEAGESEGLPNLKYGTIQDELPEGWETMSHDKIGNFYIGNMAYMSPDANFFSAAMPTDGCMDLVTINGDLSAMTATKTLLGVETGKFFDSPHVTYKKISAYRIVPRNQESGYISIDGERVPFEPFQAEMHRGLGRIISKRGVFEARGPAGWEKA